MNIVSIVSRKRSVVVLDDGDDGEISRKWPLTSILYRRPGSGSKWPSGLVTYAAATDRPKFEMRTHFPQSDYHTVLV